MGRAKADETRRKSFFRKKCENRYFFSSKLTATTTGAAAVPTHLQTTWERSGHPPPLHPDPCASFSSSSTEHETSTPSPLKENLFSLWKSVTQLLSQIWVRKLSSLSLSQGILKGGVSLYH